MGNGDTGGDRDRVGAISRVVRCGPGRAGRHFACGAERCGAAAAAISRVVRCGARPPFREFSGPRCSPPHRGAGEGDGEVLARVRRGAAGASGHAGDTVPAQPPTALTALRGTGESQEGTSQAPISVGLGCSTFAAPPPKRASCGARGASMCLACLQQSCQYPAAQSTRLYGFTCVFSTLFSAFL